MAHTDKDHPSARDFPRWHEARCPCGCHLPPTWRHCGWNCRCMKADPSYRLDGFRIGSKPSSWNRNERRAERALLRHQIQRARAGHADWDDLPTGTGRVYGRDHYW